MSAINQVKRAITQQTERKSTPVVFTLKARYSLTYNSAVTATLLKAGALVEKSSHEW